MTTARTRPRSHPRGRVVLAALAVAAIAGGGLPVALAALVAPPATAGTSTAPGTISTDVPGESTTTITVPPGVTPRAVTAVFSADQIVPGAAYVVTVDGRPAQRVPIRLYARIRVPVTAADVRADGTVVLGLTYAGPGATCPPDTGARLSKLTLTSAGTESAPATLGQFFGPAVSAIDVVVPTTATTDTLEAGITAVAALSSRYPAGVPVHLLLNTDRLPIPSPGLRIVAMAAGGSVVSTSTARRGGRDILTVSGSGQAEVRAARALGDPGLGLAGSGASQGLGGQLTDRVPTATRTLADLAAGATTSPTTASTSTLGLDTTAPTLSVALPLDAFDGPVAGLDLHLAGVHTALSADSAAALSVTYDGTLVGSIPLAGDRALDTRVTIPAALLRATGTLALSLAGCDGLATTGPAGVQVDLTGTTLTATRATGGTSAAGAGFQLLPQAYAGVLPVAIRPTGPARAAAAVDAAYLVSSLQRAAAGPLQIRLETPEQLLAGHDGGLLVGATPTDTLALQAPLRLGSTRTFAGALGDLSVTTTAAYAALQAVEHNGAQVLVLESWPGATDTPAATTSGTATRLSRRLAEGVESAGWSDFTTDPLDDVYVLTAHDAARGTGLGVGLVSTPAPSATSAPADGGNAYAKWFVLVVVVLLLLLAYQALGAVRRDRARRRTALPAVETAGHEPADDPTEV